MNWGERGMSSDELRATIRRRPVWHFGIPGEPARRFWVTAVMPHGISGWFADTGKREIVHPRELRATPNWPERPSDSATMRP